MGISFSSVKAYYRDKTDGRMNTMKDVKKVKNLLILTLVMSLFLFSFVSAKTSEDELNVGEEDIFFYQCVHEHHQGQECDLPADDHGFVELDINIDDVEIMAIECSRCDGYITTTHVGTGGWDYIGATTCNTHVNCAIKTYVRHHYYEERCGGKCAYLRRFSVPEYDYKHR